MHRALMLAGMLALAGCATTTGESAQRPLVAPTPQFSQAGRLTATPKAPLTGRHLIARIHHRTWLRATPSGRVLHHLRPHSEFGSRTVLAVTSRRGRWLQVLSPTLPNDRRGWIPARRADLHSTNYEIRVSRKAHRAQLRLRDRTILRFPVAVGAPGTETPLGRFAVTDKLAPNDPTSPYGCCALALSGHQPNLEPGWPGGDRIAIHGTPQTWTIGKAVSHGCMRAPERALRVLLRRVPLGTPVSITAR